MKIYIYIATLLGMLGMVKTCENKKTEKTDTNTPLTTKKDGIGCTKLEKIKKIENEKVANLKLINAEINDSIYSITVEHTYGKEFKNIRPKLALIWNGSVMKSYPAKASILLADRNTTYPKKLYKPMQENICFNVKDLYNFSPCYLLLNGLEKDVLLEREHKDQKNTKEKK